MNNSYPHTTTSRYYFFAPFFFALLTFITYFPTAHYGFLFDDVPNIMKFYAIRFATFKDLFFSQSRWLSAWLNTIHYAIGKFDPFSYRIFNITMHCITGIIVFFIFFIGLEMRKETCWYKKKRYLISLMTSLLFLLHPLQTQTVSYVIQGQLEGLATFFTLTIILLMLLYAKTTSMTCKIILSFLFLTSLIFALGTKDIIVVCPLLVFITDLFFCSEGSITTLIKKRWFLHLLCASIIWGGYYFLHATGKTMGIKAAVKSNVGNQLTEHKDDIITPYTFFISQFKIILHYLWIMIWPFGISVDYDEKLVKGFFAPDCILPFLLLCSLGLYSLYRFYKKPGDLMSFGIWWFFIVIAPRSTWIPATELIADYKTYLASVGIFFLLACGLSALIMKFISKKIRLALLVFLSFFLIFATYTRNKVWSSGEALWKDALAKAPKRARVYNNYANALLRQKKAQEAIPYYLKALDLENHYPDAWVNLGQAYEEIENFPKAFAAIKKALELQKSPENYLAFGNFLMKIKQYQDALEYFQGAIKKHQILKKSEYGKAWYNSGRCYDFLGDQEKSWDAHYMACMKADMDNEMGFYAYGIKSIQLQKYPEAVQAFKDVVSINPSFKHRFLLAFAHSKNNQKKEARLILEDLKREKPDDQGVLNLLKEMS